MTTDLDQLLSDRFARLAPKGDEPDWSNVLRRARRLAPPSRRPAPRRALLVTALVLGLVALGGAALALSGAGTGVPAIDRLLDRAQHDFDDVPPGAPVPDFQPRPGTVSQPLRFGFGAVRYTAVGFRARDGSICSALVDAASAHIRGGVGCAGAPTLRRALENQPFFVSGGGGGDPTIAHGFARANVVSMSLVGAGERGVVKLSKPWRSQRGRRLRFFYVITDGPARVRPRDPLLPDGVRIEARLSDGRVIRARP